MAKKKKKKHKKRNNDGQNTTHKAKILANTNPTKLRMWSQVHRKVKQDVKSGTSEG